MHARLFQINMNIIRAAKKLSVFVDTSFASLVLDGELWQRSPSSLAIHRPAVAEALRLSRTSTEVERINFYIRRCVLAYTYAAKRKAEGLPPLLLPPTVLYELRFATQVSVSRGVRM